MKTQFHDNQNLLQKYYSIFLWGFFLLGISSCYSNKPSGDEVVPIPQNSSEDIQKKVEFLGEVIEDYPEKPEYYYRRAVLYLHLNKERLAKTDIENALKLDSLAGKYHFIHAQILDIMGESEQALKSANRAQSQKARDIELDMLLGKLYFENQKPQKSVLHLQKIEKIFPKRPEVHYYKGKSYFALEDTSHAVHSFVTATVLRPDYPEAYEALGKLFNEYRKPHTALRYINKGIQNCKRKAPLYFMAGHTNRKLSRYNKAMECFKNAVKSDSTFWQASLYLSNYFLRRESFGAGKKYLEIALSVNPDIKNGYLRLGWLYEKYVKNYKTALTHYQKAQTKDAENEGIQKAIDRVNRKIADEEYKKSPEYQEKLRLLREKYRRRNDSLRNATIQSEGETESKPEGEGETRPTPTPQPKEDSDNQ